MEGKEVTRRGLIVSAAASALVLGGCAVKKGISRDDAAGGEPLPDGVEPYDPPVRGWHGPVDPVPRARRPGRLPADGPATVGGVALGAGHRVRTGLGGETTGPPAMWRTEGRASALPQAWSTLAAAFPRTGLWPVVLDGDADWPDLNLDRPVDWERRARADARDVLRRAWDGWLPPDEHEAEREIRAPFGRDFPELASPSEASGLDAVGEAIQNVERADGLALVAVVRPADVVAAIGWQGAIDVHDDFAELAAPLRSWEDRFGAYVLAMGRASMVCACTRPPETEKDALALAAEHYAFAPLIVEDGLGSVRALARLLVGNPGWYFTWD